MAEEKKSSNLLTRWYKSRKAETDARSYDENYARLKFARYLAAWLVVFGGGYFIYTRVINPKDKKGGTDFLDVTIDTTRSCYSTEDTCDEPCGRKIATPEGKYCCLKGTCSSSEEVRDCRATEVTCSSSCGRGIRTPDGRYCCLGSCP